MKNQLFAKRTALYLFQALLVTSLISLASCKKPSVDDGGETGPIIVDNDHAQGEIVVSEDYQPIDWNKTENHVAVADTATGRFVLNLGKEEAKAIEKGDIVTLDVDSAIYLRKVTSVTKSDGSVEIQTRQACLDEVFAGSTFEFCMGTPPDSILQENDSVDAATRAAAGMKSKPVAIYPSEIRYQDENGNWVKEPVSATRVKEGWLEWPYTFKKEISLEKDEPEEPNIGVNFNIDIILAFAASLTGDLLEVRPEDFEGDEEAAKKALESSKAKWKPTFYLDPKLKGTANFFFNFGGNIDKLSCDKVVGEKVIKSFVFFVGVVPVEIEIVAGLALQNTCKFTAGVDIRTSLELGLDKPVVAGMYKSSTRGWRTQPLRVGKPTLKINYPNITVGGELDDHFILGPYLALYIYHLGGPNVRLMPSLHFNAAAGAGVTFGSKDIVGDMDWTGANLTLGWDASLKYKTQWSVGVNASELLGGGAFQSKPWDISAEITLAKAPNSIACLNPEAAKIGQLCAMKFKVKSWATYILNSVTWGTLVPTPVQFRDSEKLGGESGSGVEEIKENKDDEEYTNWCYKWTDWGTGEVTVYWIPKSEESMLIATFFNSKGEIVDEVSVKPSLAPGDVRPVDLGLSVLWADRNVGAKEDWDLGDYVGWGSTSKATKQWEDPDWGDYVQNPMYGLDWYGGLYRARGIQAGSHDWVTRQWGGSWRMPLKAQWEELINKCAWVWDNDRKAYEVTGPNGKSIWLPAAGWECGTKGSGGIGTELNYWSATIDDKTPWNFSYTPSGEYGEYTAYPVAWYLYAKPNKNSSGGELRMNATQRCYRQSIRAILPKAD